MLSVSNEEAYYSSVGDATSWQKNHLFFFPYLFHLVLWLTERSQKWFVISHHLILRVELNVSQFFYVLTIPIDIYLLKMNNSIFFSLLCHSLNFDISPLTSMITKMFGQIIIHSFTCTCLYAKKLFFSFQTTAHMAMEWNNILADGNKHFSYSKKQLHFPSKQQSGHIAIQWTKFGSLHYI